MMAAASRKNVNTYHHAFLSVSFRARPCRPTQGAGMLAEPLTLAISTRILEFLPQF